MYKKLSWIFMIAILLGACRNQEEVSGTPTIDESSIIQADTTNNVTNVITIQFAISDGEQLYYEPLVQNFEADNLDVQIQLVSIGEIRAAAGDTPASVALAQAVDVFPSRFTNFGPGRASVTSDMTPFIQADPAFDAGDFYIDTLQELDGSIRVLPISVDAQLIYYQQDTFNAAGLDAPQPGWTWQEFHDATVALTAREGEAVTQWGFVEPNARYFVEGQSAAPLVTASAARFTDEDVVTAVRQYTDLFLVDAIAPLPASEDAQMRLTQTPYFASEEAQQLISSGQVVMWSDSATAFASLNDGQQVGIVPYPISTAVANTSPVHAEGLVMSAGTTQPEATWRWMDFLSHQSPLDFGSNTLLPARVSVATASGFWNNVDDELGDALRFALEHQRPFPRHAAFDSFNEAIASILNGEQPVAAALAAIQPSVDVAAEGNEVILVEPVATPAANESSADGIVRIRFLPFTLGGDGSELEPFRLLANRFEQDNPGVRIELIEGNFAASEIGRNFAFTAQSTECFQMRAPLYGLSADEEAAVLALSPFVDADPTVPLADFPEPLLKAYMSRGSLRGIPYQSFPYFIEYNKALFDAADVAYPAVDWTMDDFLATAVALTKGEGDEKQFGFVPHPYEGQTLNIMLTQLGALVVDTTLEPPTAVLTDPQTAIALQWYVDLGVEFAVKPLYPISLTNIDLRSLFQERRTLIEAGKAGMWTSSGMDVFINPDSSHLNIGVVPLPTTNGSIDTRYNQLPLGHIGSYISAMASQQQAQTCWEWIKFLSASPNAGEGIPARLSVVESSAFRQRVGEETILSYFALLGNMADYNVAVELDSDRSWLSFSSLWLGTAYEQVLANEKTAEQALVDAQQTFDAFRACLIEFDAFNDFDRQNQCAIEVDPGLATVLGQ